MPPSTGPSCRASEAVAERHGRAVGRLLVPMAVVGATYSVFTVLHRWLRVQDLGRRLGSRLRGRAARAARHDHDAAEALERTVSHRDPGPAWIDLHAGGPRSASTHATRRGCATSSRQMSRTNSASMDQRAVWTGFMSLTEPALSMTDSAGALDRDCGVLPPVPGHRTRGRRRFGCRIRA
jgi:hypothetical protein